MMNKLETKDNLIDALKNVQYGLTETVEALSAEQFITGKGELWSAENYLKHLILSIKPFVKAFNFPAGQLEGMFGRSERPSKTYDEIVTLYKGHLDDGIRAEDYDAVTPSFYRMPEGVTDVQAYLVQTWNEANDRLIVAIENHTEAALDSDQLPHPALGTITVREMCFFTLYHNTGHWRDIQLVSQMPIS